MTTKRIIAIEVECGRVVCGDCADPIEEDDEEKLTAGTKGPGVMSTGGLNQVPGMTRRAAQG